MHFYSGPLMYFCSGVDRIDPDEYRPSTWLRGHEEQNTQLLPIETDDRSRLLSDANDGDSTGAFKANAEERTDNDLAKLPPPSSPVVVVAPSIDTSDIEKIQEKQNQPETPNATDERATIPIPDRYSSSDVQNDPTSIPTQPRGIVSRIFDRFR